MTDPAGDLVAVGRIGPARGVRGEVFVQPWTDDPAQRFAPGTVFFAGAQTDRRLEVETINDTGRKTVLHFVGVGSRAQAEQLRGLELFLPATARPELSDPDEFYDSELVGLAARTVAGEPLGPVVEVLHAGGGVYLVLQIDGRERLVPFVRAIVPTVDLAAGTVAIDPPDGLFDL